MTRYTGPLLVCDLETTGLDPYEGHVLEFGAVLTTGPELTVIAEASLVIRPPGGTTEHDKLFASMPEVVREMHRANGLWELSTTDESAWNIHDADMGICEWLDGKLVDLGHVESGGGDDDIVRVAQVALAGSGVERFDRPWINQHFPKLAQRLFYRAIDVSPQRMTMDYAGREDLCDALMLDGDARPHRALPDARMTVDEVRRYIRLYQSIPREFEEPSVQDDHADERLVDIGEFLVQMGAEQGGTVDENTGEWRCSCGVSGSADSVQKAGLELYFHRRSGHQAPEDVIVEVDE